MHAPTLYHLLLGDAWHALPDVLRQVHGTDAQFAARGEMDVTIGRFIGAGLVRREGEHEHWDRRIGVGACSRLRADAKKPAVERPRPVGECRFRGLLQRFESYVAGGGVEGAFALVEDVAAYHSR